MINTPHINQLAPIAETILLPGDPLRAKFIAENFLEDSVLFNQVRGALGYTGVYNGKQVSVMGTGMGMPSMAIYSHELINKFGCKNLIRIGSCGALQEKLKLYDIIVAMSASTDSNFSHQYQLPGNFAPSCSWELLKKAEIVAEKQNKEVYVGNVLTSDVFYSDMENTTDLWSKMGTLASEMETAALYMNCARFNANALSILTVSDHLITGEETSAEQRQKSFTNMMEFALGITSSL